MRKKHDNKSSQMILIGYHSTGGYKLYDPMSKKLVINIDVIIDEFKEWDWNDNIKKDFVIILCDEPSYKAEKEIRP